MHVFVCVFELQLQSMQHGCWELNFVPLQEEQVLLSTESPLQSQALNSSESTSQVFCYMLLNWDLSHDSAGAVCWG